MDFDFLALMRFDVTFDVTLRDDSQIRVIKPSYFHFYCMVMFSIKATFLKRILVEIHLLKVSWVS